MFWAVVLMPPRSSHFVGVPPLSDGPGHGLRGEKTADDLTPAPAPDLHRALSDHHRARRQNPIPLCTRAVRRLSPALHPPIMGLKREAPTRLWNSSSRHALGSGDERRVRAALRATGLRRSRRKDQLLAPDPQLELSRSSPRLCNAAVLDPGSPTRTRSGFAMTGRGCQPMHHSRPHHRRRRPLRDRRAQVGTTGAASARCLRISWRPDPTDPHCGQHDHRAARHPGVTNVRTLPVSVTTPAAGPGDLLFDVRVPKETSSTRGEASRSRRPARPRGSTTASLRRMAEHAPRSGACAPTALRSRHLAIGHRPDVVGAALESSSPPAPIKRPADDTVGVKAPPEIIAIKVSRPLAARDRPRHPCVRRRLLSATGPSPRCTRRPACCGSPTVPTRCTCSRSPAASSASTRRFACDGRRMKAKR